MPSLMPIRVKAIPSFFIGCDAATCSGAERECVGDKCLCKSGFKEDTATTNGPEDACVAGRKCLTTDEKCFYFILLNCGQLVNLKLCVVGFPIAF